MGGGRYGQCGHRRCSADPMRLRVLSNLQCLLLLARERENVAADRVETAPSAAKAGRGKFARSPRTRKARRFRSRRKTYGRDWPKGRHLGCLHRAFWKNCSATIRLKEEFSKSRIAVHGHGIERRPPLGRDTQEVNISIADARVERRLPSTRIALTRCDISLSDATAAVAIAAAMKQTVSITPLLMICISKILSPLAGLGYIAIMRLMVTLI